MFSLKSVLLVLFALVPKMADASCRSFLVPVTVPGVSDAQLYGDLCLPNDAAPPTTVQLLVHTTGANHRYWDPPSNTYSYVQAAVAAGYATFNVDRLGTGLSTKPASYLVSVTSVEDTLHQVIAALRAGSIGGFAFSKVVWVGSSYGAAYGWVNAARHPGDVNGYVLTSIMHYTKPSFMATLALPAITSACNDLVFQHLGLDCNYVTTLPGVMAPVYFYAAYAAPGVVPNGMWDAVIRDVVSLPLLGESLATLGGITGNPPINFTPMPVATDPARSITVPSLVVIGDHDNIFCGAPDGLACDAASILAFEAPYYGVTPDVYVAQNSGHAFALQLSAPDAFNAMLTWVAARVGQ